MVEKFMNYDLEDLENPSAINKVFDKKVHKQFLKETIPDVKPEQVFDGYKKVKKPKKKVVRKSKRLKKDKKEENKPSDN